MAEVIKMRTEKKYDFEMAHYISFMRNSSVTTMSLNEEDRIYFDDLIGRIQKFLERMNITWDQVSIEIKRLVK